ncbi:hypothetical protein ACHAQH_009778 [Verticillium albo-atrum]
MAGILVVNGVEVLVPAPPGYVVDFDNPERQYVMEHYLIFGILGPLAFIALMQRFYTKIFLAKALQIDDAFMFLAWVSSVATQAGMVHTVAMKALGCHMWEVPLETYKTSTLITYVTAGIFMLCNGFTKLSLLTFYLHLSPQRWWRIAVWTSIVIVALYTVIITVMLFVHCTPVSKAYDVLMVGGSCINVGILYIATAVSNIVTDVLLFVLPIPMVVRLRMGIFPKVGAIVIFAIGSMTVGTSIVRLVFLLDVLATQDLTWDAARANIWSLIEANLFIICGSMPTLRKFFKHFAPKLMGASSANMSGPNYASGYAKKDTNTGANAFSRKVRSQYDRYEDNEMQVFQSMDRDQDNKSPNNVHQISVDGGGDVQPDNNSEKAILQTKTFTVRYD